VIQFIVVYWVGVVNRTEDQVPLIDALKTGFVTGILGFYVFVDLMWVVDPEIVNYKDEIMGALLLMIDFVRIPIYLIVESGWEEGEGFSLRKLFEC
jgi:hypothetical protein